MLDKPQDALAEYRKEAWQALQLPIARKEPFKYADLSKLWDLPLSALPPKEAAIEENTIVFSNGHFVGSKLPDDIVVLPLSAALKTYGAFLKRRMQTERDPFAQISRSFMTEGVFIYVPPAVNLQQSIRVVHKNDKGAIACPQIFLRVGKQGACKLQIEGSHYFTSSTLDIALDEGAQAKVMQRTSGGYQFDCTRASLQKDSTLLTYYLSDGVCSRCDIRAELLGTNASATLKGLSRLTGEQQAHQHLHVQHVAENTHSNQHFKTILKDNAKSSFEGKIYVEKEAQQTLAYQLNNNLLFGETAIANSKPNLEIFADDVKASHGTTMTRLNEDELFYLKSRGLSSDQAQAMLEKGFVEEILQEANDVFGD